MSWTKCYPEPLPKERHIEFNYALHYLSCADYTKREDKEKHVKTLIAQGIMATDNAMRWAMLCHLEGTDCLDYIRKVLAHRGRMSRQRRSDLVRLGHHVFAGQSEFYDNQEPYRIWERFTDGVPAHKRTFFRFKEWWQAEQQETNR